MRNHVTRYKKQKIKRGQVKPTRAVSARSLLEAFKNVMRLTAAVAAVTLTAVGAHAGYVAAAEKRYFDVTEIIVEGTHIVTREAIGALVGSAVGENIFEQSLADLGKKIEGNPWVKSVTIRRELPGKLIVTITERNPIALIRTGKSDWLMDKEGALIEKVTTAAGLGLPIISGVKAAKGPLFAGDLIELTQLAPAFMAMNKLKGYRLFGVSKLTRINVGQNDRLVIFFEGTSVTVIANRSGWTDEVSRLLTVDYLLRKKRQTVESVNLMFHDKVIVTYPTT